MLQIKALQLVNKWILIIDSSKRMDCHKSIIMAKINSVGQCYRSGFNGCNITSSNIFKVVDLHFSLCRGEFQKAILVKARMRHAEGLQNNKTNNRL